MLCSCHTLIRYQELWLHEKYFFSVIETVMIRDSNLTVYDVCLQASKYLIKI